MVYTQIQKKCTADGRATRGQLVENPKMRENIDLDLGEWFVIIWEGYTSQT